MRRRRRAQGGGTTPLTLPPPSSNPHVSTTAQSVRTRRIPSRRTRAERQPPSLRSAVTSPSRTLCSHHCVCYLKGGVQLRGAKDDDNNGDMVWEASICDLRPWQAGEEARNQPITHAPWPPLPPNFASLPPPPRPPPPRLPPSASSWSAARAAAARGGRRRRWPLSVAPRRSRRRRRGRGWGAGRAGLWCVGYGGGWVVAGIDNIGQDRSRVRRTHPPVRPTYP